MWFCSVSYSPVFGRVALWSNAPQRSGFGAPPCLTNAASARRITAALNDRRVAAVKPERVAGEAPSWSVFLLSGALSPVRARHF